MIKWKFLVKIGLNLVLNSVKKLQDVLNNPDDEIFPPKMWRGVIRHGEMFCFQWQKKNYVKLEQNSYGCLFKYWKVDENSKTIFNVIEYPFKWV